LHWKGLEEFLYSPVQTLPILQTAASRLVVVWNRRGMSSELNLENLRRESGRHEPSSDQKIFPVPGTKVAAVWMGRGLRGSASAVSPIRKYLFVRTKWAHITRNFECP
jgi:hypothetical protein